MSLFFFEMCFACVWISISFFYFSKSMRFLQEIPFTRINEKHLHSIQSDCTLAPIELTTVQFGSFPEGIDAGSLYFMLFCRAYISISFSHTHVRAIEAIIEKNAQYYHDDNMNWVDIKHRHTAFWVHCKYYFFFGLSNDLFFVKNSNYIDIGSKTNKSGAKHDSIAFSFPLTS